MRLLNVVAQRGRLAKLFAQNRAWSEQMQAQDAEFFSKLSNQQAPEYLWIGCSDSRVPANEIVGLAPGELFVHRNVGNVVVHTDLNCLSVIQFAVDLLRIKHIIVVGHYGCSGVRAALAKQRIGLADNWLRHIQDVAEKYQARLNAIDDDSQKHSLLCELNVVEQVTHVCRTAAVTDAWERGQELSVHGWIYGLGDGLLRDLAVTVSGHKALVHRHADALANRADTSRRQADAPFPNNGHTTED